jgi:hypothetical protein
MKRIVKLNETKLRRIINSTVKNILKEGYKDDDLYYELKDAGATGGATEEQIKGWEEDLWININKTYQNANYLFNKTRDERYAKISEIVSNAFDMFPKNASSNYMTIDYDPENGYGG